MEGHDVTASALLLFAGAYLAVLIMPGPGVTALVARVLARGTQGVPAFIAGFVAGALAWFTLAATGMALLAALLAPVFLAIRYAGAAYLLWLAWKLWRAMPRAAQLQDGAPDSHRQLFLLGLAINLGNPKVILFFLALLPTVVDLASLPPLGFVELAGLVALLASGVLSGYALVASRARRLLTAPRAQRLVNRGSAAVVAGAAASVALR